MTRLNLGVVCSLMFLNLSTIPWNVAERRSSRNMLILSDDTSYTNGVPISTSERFSATTNSSITVNHKNTSDRDDKQSPRDLSRNSATNDTVSLQLEYELNEKSTTLQSSDQKHTPTVRSESDVNASKEVKTEKFIIYNKFILTTSIAALHVYVLPIVVVIGVIGNSLVLVQIIARSLFRRSPMFVYIFFISLFDLLYVLTEGLPTAIETHFDVYVFSSSNRWCSTRLYISWSVVEASVWILIVASVDKLYCIARPLAMLKREKNRRFVTVSCLVVLVLVLIAECKLLWMAGMNSGGVTETGETILICYITREYAWFTKHVFPWLDMSIYTVLPGIILFVVSVAILGTFLRSYFSHKKMTANEQNSSRNQTYSQALNSVVLLLPLALLHVTCSIPMAMISLSAPGHSSDLGLDIFVWSNLFSQINHSVNIFLQLAFSSFFRRSLFGKSDISRKHSTMTSKN